MNTSVLKADGQTTLEKFCDVIKKQTRDGSRYSVYVLENQETVDYESKFFLATMMGRKRVSNELLKQNTERTFFKVGK